MNKYLKMILGSAMVIAFHSANAQLSGLDLVPAAPDFDLPMSVFVPPPPTSEWAELADEMGVNHEGQVAAECIGQYGASQAAAACIATKLTVDEIAKCFSDGVGGHGCFGDSNTVVQILRDNFDAAQREADPASAWIRLSTGISPGDIQENGPLGGENSDARKVCNGIAGLFGGKC